MMQVEHILVANELQVVTKEVVETARENLIVGLSRASHATQHPSGEDELSQNRSFVVTKRDTAHACGASLPLYHFPILLKSC